MDKIVQEYLADKIMEDLRNNKLKPFEGELATAAIKDKILDNMVGMINEKDKTWILGLIQQTDQRLRWIGILLTRSKYMKDDDEIRDALIRMWDESDQYFVKRGLIARLLDYDIPLDIHRKLFDYIKANWDRYVTDLVVFMGGIDNILGSCKKRIKIFPLSKAWAYLVVSSASKDRSNLISLLEKYVNSKESINSEVATWILENKVDS